MVFYDFLARYLQVFGKFVILGKNGQIPFIIGRKHSFVKGVKVPDTSHDILDEIFMMYQIGAPQMKNAGFVSVNDVV